MNTITIQNALKAVFGTSVSTDNSYGVAILNNASGHQGEPVGVMGLGDLRTSLGFQYYRLEDGTDLNEIRSRGEYYVSTTASAQTLDNCPVANGFVLRVYYGGGYVIIQELFCATNVASPVITKYVRGYRTGKGWGAWKQVQLNDIA